MPKPTLPGPAWRALRRGAHAEAAYRNESDPVYRGNPLIEALPELKSRADVVQNTKHLPPPVSDEQRRLPAHVREHRLAQIGAFKVPLSQDLRLYQTLESLMRTGYVARNPLAGGAVGALNARVGTLGAPGVGAGTVGLSSTVLEQTLWGTARQLTVLGPSGGGKSLGLHASLGTFPQTIAHTEYGGRPFLATQVPWLVLECPHDSSTRSLCIQFFSALDEVLRTTPGVGEDGPGLMDRYVDRYARVHDLVPRMARVARLIHLGVLALDEVQLLYEVRHNGAQLLNFLLQLVNSIGVPVVLVGTYKAYPIFAGQLRLARRGATDGDLLWRQLREYEDRGPGADPAVPSEPGVDWTVFTRALFRYQYVRNPVDHADASKLVSTLYAESQGIPDIAVKLFALAQRRAIKVGESTGVEALSPDLIEAVAREEMALARPILNALRNPRTHAEVLARLDDVQLPTLTQLLHVRLPEATGPDPRLAALDDGPAFSAGQAAGRGGRSLGTLDEGVQGRSATAGEGALSAAKSASDDTRATETAGPETQGRARSRARPSSRQPSGAAPGGEDGPPHRTLDGADRLRALVDTGKVEGRSAYATLVRDGFVWSPTARGMKCVMPGVAPDTRGDAA